MDCCPKESGVVGVELGMVPNFFLSRRAKDDDGAALVDAADLAVEAADDDDFALARK